MTDKFLEQMKDTAVLKLEEMDTLIEEKRAELEALQSTRDSYQAVVRAASGEVTTPAPRRASNGSRAPRAVGAEIQSKIKAALADGKQPVADLIKSVGLEGQKVRNQLTQLVKKNEIKNHGGGVYSLSL